MNVPNNISNMNHETLSLPKEVIYTLKGDSNIYPEQLIGRIPEVVWKRMTINEKVTALKEMNLTELLEEVSIDDNESSFQESQPESVQSTQLNDFAKEANNIETASSEPKLETQNLQPIEVPTQPITFDAEAQKAHDEFKSAASEMRDSIKSDDEALITSKLEQYDNRQELEKGLSAEEKQRIAQEQGQNLLPSQALPPKFFGYQISNVNDPASNINGPVHDAKTWASVIFDKVIKALSIKNES